MNFILRFYSEISYTLICWKHLTDCKNEVFRYLLFSLSSTEPDKNTHMHIRNTRSTRTENKAYNSNANELNELSQKPYDLVTVLTECRHILRPPIHCDTHYVTWNAACLQLLTVLVRHSKNQRENKWNRCFRDFVTI